MPLFLNPAAAPALSAAKGPTIEHFTLPNGLDVVVIPDHRAPVVTHMVWYRVGAADEPKRKSGIAHFLEHLMFKGTARNPNGFSDKVSELGGQENAFTGHDYTAYFQRVAKEHLGTMMGFEADRMADLALTDAKVDPERDVVLEERKMRVDNDPSSQLGEEIAQALFTHHPYGTPIIGWQDEIEGLTRQDAIDFHDRFYTPNNATLVVAGDVDADTVRRLAGESYGRLARRAEPPPRIRPQEPPQRAERRVTLADPRVEQPVMQRHWRMPSYRTAAPGVAEAIEVMAQIIGGGPTSRLYRALVAEEKIATSAGVWYGGSSVDEARFALWATPRPETGFDALEAGVERVIERVAGTGVDEAELDRAKTRLVAETVFAQDSQTALARTYGSALSVGLPIDSVATWPARIAAVTAQEVRDAARAWLAGVPAVTGLLAPTA